MSHVRQQIRDRIATTMGSVGTTYTTRIVPLAEGSLPCVLVYTGGETIELGDFGKLSRVVEMVVEYVAQGASGLDATLDTKIAAIETAIAGDTTLAALVIDIYPTAVELIFDTTGAQPIGRARITLAAHYRTTLADPQTSI